MKTALKTVLLSVAGACAPLVLFVGVHAVLPAVAPALFWLVPVGVAVGFTVLWRRWPEYSYPIGVLYVPMMSGLLVMTALLISWYIVGDYL
jgi:hypothetical protein